MDLCYFDQRDDMAGRHLLDFGSSERSGTFTHANLRTDYHLLETDGTQSSREDPEI